MKRIVAALALVAAAEPASTQALRPVLGLDTAAHMRDTCLAWAKGRKLNIAIAVYDDSGRLMTFARMDGANTAVSDIAMWKGRSAATYRVASAETAKWNNPAFPGIATGGGGVPVFTKDGQPLGSVGVSGAVTEDDIACAEAAISAASLRSKAP
ncbi:MAG: GlcG/HbpS family heme-binding protein [Sphingomicrobium sp.]